MPFRITQESYRPRVSDRTMVGTLPTALLVSFRSRTARHRMTKSTAKWSLATRGNLHDANASFSRHGEIYRYAGDCRRGQAFARPSPQHFDEFPVGYSLAGCSPAEPASASPTASHLAVNGLGRSSLGRARLPCTWKQGLDAEQKRVAVRPRRSVFS
jgi:hypothetical protein